MGDRFQPVADPRLDVATYDRSMVTRWSRAGAKRRAGLLATSIPVLLLLGVGLVQAATGTVAAVNFEFQPASRAVKEGDIVRWTFSGDPHTVTSGTPGYPDGRFDSGIVNPGGSFQVTFDAAGTYPYFCQIHPEQMIGTIVVTEGAAPTPAPTAKPTAKPTARPTAKPTARPTAAPTVAATAAPTAPPTPSATASESPAPRSASPTAPPTGSPAASSSALGAVPPSAAPGEAGGDGETAAAGDPIPIVVGVVVLGLLAAGGFALARRARAGA